MRYARVWIEDRDPSAEFIGRPSAPVTVRNPFLAAPELDELLPEMTVEAFVVPPRFTAIVSRAEQPEAVIEIECSASRITLRSICFRSAPEWTPCSQCWEDLESGSLWNFGQCDECGDGKGLVYTGTDAMVTKDSLKGFPLREALRAAVEAASSAYGADEQGRQFTWPLRAVRMVTETADTIAILTIAHDDPRNVRQKLDLQVLAELQTTLDGYLDSYEQAVPRPKRGAAITDAWLEGVAAVYRDATADGRPPTAAVKEHFQTSRPTAARWVQEARRRGILGKTTPRKRGEEQAP
jgi:hypothetical protein